MTVSERPTVVVFGSTGSVGREVVAQLRDAKVGVRAVTRDPASASIPPGIDAVRGDLYDRASLEPALEGVDAVFLLWPSFSPKGSEVAIEAIGRHAERVVYLSAQAAEADPSSVWAVVEAKIAETGADWTFLRPTGFAKNTLGWADQIARGVVRWPFGRAARSLIDERDIAAVAVRALTEPGHGGKTYVLSGPEALTQAEQVRIIGDAIGRPVRWQDQDRAEARQVLVDIFGSEQSADQALDTWERFVTEPEAVTSTVEELTGRPARSFAEWAHEHADVFRRPSAAM